MHNKSWRLSAPHPIVLKKEIVWFLFSKRKLFGRYVKTQHSKLPPRTKRADHSMTLPSLTVLGGSPEPGHLRSAH